MFCPSCQTENPSIAAFCSNCGYNLKQFTELTDLELLRETLAAKDYRVERKLDGERILLQGKELLYDF